ncbi:MAG TPA: hypothetical protein VGL77_03455 [Armatimonadota bacterium]
MMLILSALLLAVALLPSIVDAPLLYLPISLLAGWGVYRLGALLWRQPILILLDETGHVEFRSAAGSTYVALHDIHTARFHHGVRLEHAQGSTTFGARTGNSGLWDFLALLREENPNFVIASAYITLMLSRRQTTRLPQL